MEGLKHKWDKFRRYVSGSPIEGEKYTEAPKVEDLPHMVDADGALVAVSSGKHDLSPVMSAKLHIQTGKGASREEIVDKIDDSIK